MTFFKKNKKNEYTFILKNIDVAKIDRDFNMDDIKNIDISTDIKDDSITSLEKLGISSLKVKPLTTLVHKEKLKLSISSTMIDYKDTDISQIKNIPCYFCHRKFNSVSLGLPVKIDNNKFICDGIFCSFNCMYSFIDENNSSLYRECRYLIPILYKRIFGKYPETKINKSPHWRLRTEYGGILSDTEYESNLQSLSFEDINCLKVLNEEVSLVSKIYSVREINCGEIE